ncbi:MAG: DegT/DnrJ/EryC1/StrS family aminotransferase [Terriglobia bacterium]|jgi:perosamine synthetase
MERIPVSGPWITQREIDYVTDAVAHAWYSNANMYHARLERAFADYLGVRFAMALPSCTSALHLSLLALGVGPGDEVIVPEITWIATAAPITYVGATPVFADIDPRSWCLSPASCQAWITPRTKAMIPVDLYGNMPDMDGLRCLATQHHIAIIEDAAEAIGSEYKGRKAGSLGDTGTFSFHGSKTLTTGEGGMLVTNREDVYQRALFLRDHGRPPGDKMFFNTEVAYKYKMSSMQAALGLAQLERVEELACRKREIFSWYEDELSDVEGVTLNYQAPGTKSSYWMVTVVLDEKMGIGKNRLLQAMDEMNIDCRPFFHPLSSLPAYATLRQGEQARQRNAISYQISPYAINLPSGFNMTLEKVRYVGESLKEIVRQSRLARV